MDKAAQSQHIRTTIADTPEEMLSVQHEIWMKNPLEKRLEMTLSFIDSCRKLNLDGIKNSHAGWSEMEVQREYFKLCYKNIFSEPILNDIIKIVVK